MQLERRQTQNGVYCMSPFIENSKRCKITYSDRIEITGCLGPGG